MFTMNLRLKPAFLMIDIYIDYINSNDSVVKAVISNNIKHC